MRIRAMRGIGHALTLLAALAAVTCPNEASFGQISQSYQMQLGKSLFVPNAGQWADESIVYGLHTSCWSVAFRTNEIELTLRRSRESDTDSQTSLADADLAPVEFEQTHLTVSFPGSNEGVMPTGVDPTPTTINYFVGGDGRSSAANLTSYSGIMYTDLYPGIDLLVKGNDTDGTLKYEFHVAPGADPAQIQLQYDGLDCPLTLDEHGNLEIETALGTLTDRAPVAYQVIDGATVDVPTAYSLCDEASCSLSVNDVYDAAYPLVIDPDLLWMYYLGGNDEDEGYQVALDADGTHAYICGYTWSWNFERSNNSHHGDYIDAFVCRVNLDPYAVSWMTYLGGTDTERAYAVAVDSAGDAVVVGETKSLDFDGQINPYRGFNDAFICKVNTSGVLEWMRYLGGNRDDYGNGLVMDATGTHAFVVGHTNSPDFEGRVNDLHVHEYDIDAYVCMVNMTGEIGWMAYLGGFWNDRAEAVATDSQGTLYVAGVTDSNDFEGALNSRHIGLRGEDAFICRVTPAGSIDWMRYLGGTDRDWGMGIAIVPNVGVTYVTGYTFSTDFEGKGNTYHGGVTDAFVCRIDAAGTQEWMTYVGGTGADYGFGSVVDAEGANLYIAGSTSSYDLAGKINEFHPSTRDAFISSMTPDGSVSWSAYFGGSGIEYGRGVALDGAGNAYISGFTSSSDFEGHGNPYRQYTDAYMLKYRLDAPTRPCLSLDGTCPGKATISLCCNSPGDRLVIAYSLHAGSTEVLPYCPGLKIDLAEPKIAASGTADANGCLEVQGRLPGKSCGRLLVQGVNLTTCEKSRTLLVE